MLNRYLFLFSHLFPIVFVFKSKMLLTTTKLFVVHHSNPVVKYLNLLIECLIID
jgi:hypothetical protein